jgi:hypothetical protein
MTAIPGSPADHDRFRKRPSRVSDSRWISPGAVGLFLALGSCALPGVVPVSADGDYRGTATRFQVLRRTCPRPGLLTLSVRSSVMYYRWDNQYIPVSVQSNGTLSGAGAGVQLTGTHDGTTMQGDVTDGQCGLHFTVRKIGT